MMLRVMVACSGLYRPRHAGSPQCNAMNFVDLAQDMLNEDI